MCSHALTLLENSVVIATYIVWYRYSSQQEVAALKRAQGHPNVVLLHEVLDDKVCMCVHLLHPCVCVCTHVFMLCVCC